MKDTTLGIFMDRKDAEGAITELTDEGYNAENISIIMKDNEARSEIIDNTGANVAGGALSGAAKGSAVGGLAGLLIGIGAIAIPGIGGVLIGGPIAVALGLTGASAMAVQGAVTGAVAGGLLGSLVGLGLPTTEARIYEERIKEGAILVAVNSVPSEIRRIFEKNGATQIRTLK